MTGRARVLIVEDTQSQAELLRALLAGMGHDLRMARTAAEAFETVRDWQPHAVLLDLDLPDYSGLELLRRLRADGVETAVIVITATASLGTAVDVMREGAVDFLVKPFNKARLTVTLSNCLEKQALAAELRDVRGKLERAHFFNFIGACPEMQAVYRTIETVAASRASVFVTGESGTGKELVADALHRASPRRDRPFIALNCGAIPKDLLESEIFGHVKGAFTGATEARAGAARAADGGTLFLDEIGEMPLEMQVKLLRFVQTGSFSPVGSTRTEKVDVRFVCATNRDPLREVEEGRFRDDLFYRLYVIPLELPPLRQRGEDVLLLARHFLQKFAREERRRFRGFSAAAERRLAAYSWPGNVRQLENAVRNIVVLHDADLVEEAMLPPGLLRLPRPPAEPASASSAEPSAARPSATSGVPAPEPAFAHEATLPAALAPEPPPPAQPAAVSSPAQPAAVFPPAQPAAVFPPAQPVSVSSPAAVAPPAAWPAPAELAAPSAPPTPQDAASRALPIAVEAAPAVPAPIEIVPLAEMERRLILAALERTQSDVPRAASLLGVNPSTVYRKLQSWRAAGELL